MRFAAEYYLLGCRGVYSGRIRFLENTTSIIRGQEYSKQIDVKKQTSIVFHENVGELLPDCTALRYTPEDRNSLFMYRCENLKCNEAVIFLGHALHSEHIIKRDNTAH
jgi:hypothetical protein